MVVAYSKVATKFFNPSRNFLVTFLVVPRLLFEIVIEVLVGFGLRLMVSLMASLTPTSVQVDPVASFI